MNLFGCKFCSRKNDGTGDDVACDRKNFDSLLWALVTVFQVPGKISGYLKCNKSSSQVFCLPGKIAARDIKYIFTINSFVQKKNNKGNY